MAVAAPERYDVAYSTPTYRFLPRPSDEAQSGPTELVVVFEPALSSHLFEGYRLVAPVTVYVAEDEECLVASDDVSTVFGTGGSTREALMGYIDSMTAQLRWFEQNIDQIGAGLLREYQELRRRFVRA